MISCTGLKNMFGFRASVPESPLLLLALALTSMPRVGAGTCMPSNGCSAMPRKLWWGRVDLNNRCPKAADLQSAALTKLSDLPESRRIWCCSRVSPRVA